MKRFIISLLFVLTIIIFLVQPTTLNALFALVLLGIIPGTDVQIPFWVSFTALLVGGTLLIRWLASQPLYIGGLAQQEITARKLARKKIVKKASYSSPRTVARRKVKVHSTKKRSIARSA